MGFIPVGVCHVSRKGWSLDHLFIHHKFASMAWKWLFKELDFSFCLPCKVEDWVGLLFCLPCFHESKVNKWATMVGCEVGSFPSSYLGFLLGHNSKTSLFWEPVVDKVRKRLARWKRSFFSKWGRLTLIRSVLSGMLNYHRSIQQEFINDQQGIRQQ